MSTNSDFLSPDSEKPTNYTPQITIIGILFFIFGFVTWLNSILIPFLKQACELSNFEAYWVTFAFYISYFVMSIPSSIILEKTGFTKGMSLGLAIMGVGSLIFIPAAQSRMYGLFLLGLFVQGTGLALLQTASNPYITILGPIESAAKRMSIMGICNKLAGMIGIFVLGSLLFGGTEELAKEAATLTGAAREADLDQLAAKVIVPYIVMAVLLFGLALMILKAHLPEVENEEEDVDESSLSKEKTSVFQFPHLVLGVLCLFVYVGLEVLAIDTLTLYGDYFGFDKLVASQFAIYSLVALTIGYLIGIVVVPKYISQRKALIICGTLGLIFAVLALLTSGIVSIIFIILLSFAHSLMWPAIWPLALNKLGKFTKFASALLVMGIAGGAILPLIYGKLADLTNRQEAYWIMIPCYLYILYYAYSGYKAGLKNEKA